MRKGKEKIRYVLVDDGYNTAAVQAAAAQAAEARAAEAEGETEIEDETDLRLECLKLAITFAKTKDEPPIPVAKQFLAFVLAQEPAAGGGEGEEPDGRTRP